MGTISKHLALTGAVAALGMGLAFAPSADASPRFAGATADVTVQARKDVCFTGACGSATVKFTSRNTADVRMSVNDTICRDSKKPKMRIQALQYSYSQQKTYVWKGPWHKYTKGCGGYQLWTGGFRGEEPLYGMRVEICNASRCETSGWMNNPR